MKPQNNPNRSRSGSGKAYALPENNLVKGSSETTREALHFDFSEYFKHKLSAEQSSTGKQIGVKYADPESLAVQKAGGFFLREKDFLEWFIESAEGDGSFIISASPYGEGRLSFLINQKDRRLLDKIAKGLGFGTVNRYQQPLMRGDKKVIRDGEVVMQTLHRYAVGSFEEITSLIHIFNGNILIRKVQTRFQQWLRTYNAFAKVVSGRFATIPFRPNMPAFTLQSAWFAGFVDAEGGFYASFTPPTDNTRERLRTKFYITQKAKRRPRDSRGYKGCPAGDF